MSEHDTGADRIGLSVANVECVRCDSRDCVEEESGYRCLDCGSSFERAPTGDLVMSTNLWWVERIGYAAIILGLPINMLWAYYEGMTLAILIGLVALPLVIYLDGPKVAEAVQVLRGTN